MGTSTQIDLLRHGEPEGGSKYRGQSDDPLSEVGWAQMRRAVGGATEWDLVVSSPLRRCLAFAQELAEQRGYPLHVDADFKEVGFGAWEGCSKAEIKARSPETVARFYADPVQNRPEGAEPLTAFRDRVRSAWEGVLECHHGKRVLVVAHAGVIRMVLGIVLQAPLESAYRIHVPYAGMTRIAVPQGESARAQLLFHAGSPATVD